MEYNSNSSSDLEKETCYEKRELYAVGCNAVIFNSRDEVLLLLRSNNNIYRPNSWDLPGGKMISIEKPNEAIRRETFEETGIYIDVLTAIDVEFLNKPTCINKILSIKYLAICYKTTVKLSKEHKHHCWSSIKNLPTDLDIDIKRLILKGSLILPFLKNDYNHVLRL